MILSVLIFKGCNIIVGFEGHNIFYDDSYCGLLGPQ